MITCTVHFDINTHVDMNLPKMLNFMLRDMKKIKVENAYENIQLASTFTNHHALPH